MKDAPRTIALAGRNIPLTTFAKYLTGAMYIAGAIGLSLPASRSLFQFLTPFNLLFTAIVLVYFQADRSAAFWTFALIAAFLGFASEVLGVATGFPFGDYVYGPTLGVKLWEVPLTIGLNWLVLAYVCGYLVRSHIKTTPWLQVPLAAALMVALDVVIEPVAIRYDFWSWAQGTPPIENYVGWFGVALIIQGAFFSLPFAKRNPLAAHIFIIEATFFILCLILAQVI